MSDDNANPTDASLSECGHQRFERNHYFHGKLMTARDMVAEQSYHVRQRRAHARSVGGSGVVWGLDTTVEEDGDGDLLVTVTKGYAIDDCGRPVVVPEKHTKTVTDETVVGSTVVGVWVSFESCLKESVPVDGAESACEDECAYNRVLEVYDIEVEDASASPSNPTPDDPDSVAKTVPSLEFPDREDYAISGREQPGVADPALSTIAESFRDEIDADWSEPSDSRLYLGTFSAPPDTSDETEWERDPTQPEPLVYTNDMLYAATARHAADFENPHQVSLTSSEVPGENAAVVSTLDDESDAADVTVSGADGSVDVDHASGDTIDLSVTDHVDDVVESRIEPLERYTVEKALKYTGRVFRTVPSRFSGEAGELGAEVATKARSVSDGRLQAASDAEAAEELVIRDEDGNVERVIEGDVYETVFDEFLELEQSFNEAVSEQVTAASAERLDLAVGRLESALDESEPSHREMGAAQDDVVDAVEWLDPAETASASLQPTVTSVARGDIVELTVELEGTDTATLVVGSEEVNYESTAELTDGSGDGSVTVRMNTYSAGRSDGEESAAFGTVDEADSVSATLETDALENVLAAGSYDISVLVDGRQVDVGQLALQARTTGALSVMRAPTAAFRDGLNSYQAVRNGIDAGTVTDAGEVVPAETIVLAIEASGVFGALAEHSGSDQTAIAVLEPLLTSSVLDLSVVSTADAETPVELDLSATDSAGDLRGFADQEDGRLFVLFDSGAAVFTRDGSPAEVAPGDGFEAEFTVSGDGPLITTDGTDGESVADEFTFIEADGAFDTDEEQTVLVADAPNQTITGATNLAPGTEAQIKAQATGEVPFLKTRTTTVGTDESFVGAFNFSQQSPDTSFQLTFDHSLLEITADGVVVDEL
jgi:hypothetical protein